MPVDAQLEDITRTIQLAVAPVFLLSGIGTALSVFTTRLGRVIDRARALEGRLEDGLAPEFRHVDIAELRGLERRLKWIHGALTLGIIAAALVCVLIAAAFVGYFASVNLGFFVAGTFILAMIAFLGALLAFLREIFLAIGMFRLRIPADAHDRPSSPPADAP